MLLPIAGLIIKRLMNKAILTILIIAALLIGGYFVLRSKTLPSNRPSALPISSPSSTSLPSKKQSFELEADDSGASLTTIQVKKGTSVDITFKVKSAGVYYGGLDFRSSVVNSGTIKPGESKTISFTTEDSFDFVPFWPASNVRKPYTISIKVE